MSVPAVTFLWVIANEKPYGEQKSKDAMLLQWTKDESTSSVSLPGFLLQDISRQLKTSSIESPAENRIPGCICCPVGGAHRAARLIRDVKAADREFTCPGPHVTRQYAVRVASCLPTRTVSRITIQLTGDIKAV